MSGGLSYAGYISFNGTNPTAPAANNTSGPFTNAGNNCMENRPGTNEIWTVQITTTQHLYGIDASTMNILSTTGGVASSVLGGTSPTFCAGIAFPVQAGLASALVFNNTNTVTNILEISTGYTTNQTNAGISGVYAKSQQQAAASLVTQGTVWATSKFGSALTKWTTANFTAANVVPDWLTNDTACCIIAIPNGNFLVGTILGSIFEMDVSGTKVAHWQAQPDSAWESFYAVDSIASMAFLQYYDNIVMAMDSHGALWKIHWPTKTVVLHEWRTDGAGGGIQGATSNNQISVVPCPGASGYMFTPQFWQAGNLNSLVATDWTQNPITTDSFMVFQYTAGTNQILNAAYAAPCQRIAFYHPTPNLLFFLNFTPQTARAEVSSSLFDSSAFQKGRIIRLVDAGASGVSVVLDALTDSVSSNPYPTPSGKAIIEFASYGEGVNEKGSLSTYNT